MKVVINSCFGGFSLSPRAVKRLAELNGRECYFFTTEYSIGGPKEIRVTLEELEKKPSSFFSAYDIPSLDSLPDSSTDTWVKLSMEDRQKCNEEWDKHSLGQGWDVDRTDPKLIQVVEELGGEHRTGASGACAELKIVEIPDGVEYEIDEYDGNESIHEVHRSWA